MGSLLGESEGLLSAAPSALVDRRKKELCTRQTAWAEVQKKKTQWHEICALHTFVAGSFRKNFQDPEDTISPEEISKAR